ncbi:MAG: hypothetical protein CL916_14015 [Deltaproteobacteria bacterium]|nr:hypothetical protein [Deltaproteobacteria bacterium]
MSQDTIELDEFVTLYSGYLSKQLNESMQEAWKEQLWKEQKEEYTEEYNERSKELKGVAKLTKYEDFIIISSRIIAGALFLGLCYALHHYWRFNEIDWEEWSWKMIQRRFLVIIFYIVCLAVGFFCAAFHVEGVERNIHKKISDIKYKRRKEERENEKTLNEDAKSDFLSQDAPKIKGEFILQFCLHQADDVVDAYTKELRTKKKEAFDFIKRQEDYCKEVQSTFSSDSEKGKSLLTIIEERIFHTKFRMKNIDEMIAQSNQFKVTLEQQAQKVLKKIKEREAEQKLAAKIQQDNGEGLDLNLTDDEDMLDSFQTLETFLSESSCFVDMVQEMDNDSPIT